MYFLQQLQHKYKLQKEYENEKLQWKYHCNINIVS